MNSLVEINLFFSSQCDATCPRGQLTLLLTKNGAEADLLLSNIFNQNLQELQIEAKVSFGESVFKKGGIPVVGFKIWRDFGQSFVNFKQIFLQDYRDHVLGDLSTIYCEALVKSEDVKVCRYPRRLIEAIENKRPILMQNIIEKANYVTRDWKAKISLTLLKAGIDECPHAYLISPYPQTW